VEPEEAGPVPFGKWHSLPLIRDREMQTGSKNGIPTHEESQFLKSAIAELIGRG
jgi:hypothetical protein